MNISRITITFSHRGFVHITPLFLISKNLTQSRSKDFDRDPNILIHFCHASTLLIQWSVLLKHHIVDLSCSLLM